MARHGRLLLARVASGAGGDGSGICPRYESDNVPGMSRDSLDGNSWDTVALILLAGGWRCYDARGGGGGGVDDDRWGAEGGCSGGGDRSAREKLEQRTTAAAPALDVLETEARSCLPFITVHHVS